MLWPIVFTILLGVYVFARAVTHSWEQWYDGRLNRKTFEQWRRQRGD